MTGGHGGDKSQEDYKLKDMKPELGEQWPKGAAAVPARPGGGIAGWLGVDKPSSTYDLVEQMFYLYVRVVKAKDLPPNPVTSTPMDPYVEVKLGNYKGTTKHYDRRANPEWDQVFAFSKSRVQSNVLEVFLKDREMLGRDDYVGKVVFDMREVPTRVPPDSPLAPQWYRLEERRGEGKVRGELMLAVWIGTQADEAFPDAWHSDASSVQGEGVQSVRSKAYVSPKLWYLRVNVIEAQDVQPQARGRAPEVFVKAQVGNQILKTSVAAPTPTLSPRWNEDLVFVVAEPFEEQLVLTVENKVTPAKDEVMGRLISPLRLFDKRLDHRPFVQSRWFDLEKFGFGAAIEGETRRELRFASRIHLRVCLEGGYHVMDESTLYISDVKPTARQLWKSPVGILEVGILSAQGLSPMKTRDGRGTTDAYCVAKYGQKWVRTRTMIGSFAPTWNEQYTWEVFDPCTVITIGVFDNCHLGNGNGNGNNAAEGGRGTPASARSRVGKIRWRCTREARTRTRFLFCKQKGQKMGEVQLAVRFTCLSLMNMVHLYTQPLLPRMHYLHPFTVNQLDSLRYQAMRIGAARPVPGAVRRAGPPLRREVVEYMLDVESHMWSMRRSKANFFRAVSLFSGAAAAARWFNDVCHWKNVATTALVHILLLILICYPELILPTTFLYMFLIGLWNYRRRPRHPPHMDTKMSWAEAASPDELDEEFDTFPTSRPQDVVYMRYDRLRSVAGRIQTVVGDMATQGERLQSLLSWRDPRATCLFVVFCLLAAVVLYVTPFKIIALAGGMFWMRHPRFRSRLPSVPSNFFRRLPSRADCML
uniref:FT-interacting protein 1 n=1 Tax=Dendrobium hybrid cultivar TaxID=136990 RepID=A0A2R4LPJ7_9ASPA|nr:FT-interacting protein 1 [Dendrobium hybrid cultivar]